MEIEVKRCKGSIFDLAKRLGAEFIAVISERGVVIDKFYRGISDYSGNITTWNTEKSVSKLVGKEVIWSITKEGIDVFLARDLCPEIDVCSKYLGTGGGMQALCWAKNQKRLIKVLNKILPEVDRIEKISLLAI